MSWKQRGSGATSVRPRQTNQPVYEDFDPKIDTNENEGARVVVLHVPGFLKDQMKITCGNSLRVEGQRPLLNNKWSRFNKLIPVPATCEISKIHAKYHNGILTITMPKEVPRTEKPAEKTTRDNISDALPTRATEGQPIPQPLPPPPAASEKANQKATEVKGNEKTFQTVPKHETNTTGGVVNTPQKTSSEEKKAEKNLGEVPQTVDSAAERNARKTGGQSRSPQKGTTEPKGQTGHGKEGLAKGLDLAEPRKASGEQKAKKGLEVSSSGMKKVHETIEKPKDGDKVVDKSSEKAKESTQKGKESAEAPLAKIEDIKKTAGNEKPNEEEAAEATNGNKLGIKHIAETAKQTMSNMVKRLNDDDRQLLINIGAAVMVLVALGAYVSYGNFGSSMENEN